jgi:hypothetical protein
MVDGSKRIQPMVILDSTRRLQVSRVKRQKKEKHPK